jgi:hypothetical protein
VPQESPSSDSARTILLAWHPARGPYGLRPRWPDPVADRQPRDSCCWGCRVATVERIQRMEHVGIVVDDLAAARRSSSGSDSSCRARAGRGRLAGPRWPVEGVRGGDRDGGDPGGPRTARTDEVSRPAGPGRRPARAGTPRASAMSHSQSTISTPSLLAARSSLARWSGTTTVNGSATSAARRDHRRAGGADRLRLRPAPTASPASVAFRGRIPFRP